MIGDATQDVGEPGLRVDDVELRGLDQPAAEQAASACRGARRRDRASKRTSSPAGRARRMAGHLT